MEKNLIKVINNTLEILEDFVSPLSDTYQKNYFEEEIDKVYLMSKDLLQLNPILVQKTNVIIENFKSEDFKLNNQIDNKINHQYNASDKICSLLDLYIKYGLVFKLFYPFEFKFEFSFYGKILEKLENLKKLFRNLFEYVFLVRDIDKIDQKELDRVSGVAKLYPDFERTINLIHQRSKLISFLMKVIDEREVAECYEELSVLIKQMPDKKRMTGFIIKNNLIDPYNKILSQQKYIFEVLNEKKKDVA